MLEDKKEYVEAEATCIANRKVGIRLHYDENMILKGISCPLITLHDLYDDRENINAIEGSCDHGNRHKICPLLKSIEKRSPNRISRDLIIKRMYHLEKIPYS